MHVEKTSPKQLNRRKFIGLGALASASLLFPQCEIEEDEPLPIVTNHKAIVIGSGFGGAVTALRLTQAGIPVTMLERGQRWQVKSDGDTFSPNIPADKRSTWMRRRTVAPLGPPSFFEKHAGVLDRYDFQNMNVYAGAGVGGGSLVYGGITVKPVRELFQQVLPSGINYGELESTYFPRVINTLGASRIPDDLYETEYYQYARTAITQAEKAGLDAFDFPQAANWDIIRQEIAGTKPKSALVGELLYGNNSGSKLSLDQNYLPAAEATGLLDIHTLHQVKEIRATEDERYAVLVDEISTSGAVVQTKLLLCEYLFLGAGSVGTTKLLVKAKATGTLSQLNEHIGQGWGANGNVMGIRSLIGESTGQRQASPPVRGAFDLNNPHAPLTLDYANYPLGLDCNCSLQLGLVFQKEERGHFVYNRWRDDVDLVWNSNYSDQAATALRDTLNRLNNANQGVIGSLLLPDITGDFTYHPIGGAVMDKACDLYGRVKGYEKLYVMDGAFIPGTTACANPSLTIAAFAERSIEHIISNDFA